ncbi:MAG: hypothetical protein HY527_12690 [Betaproteobacteria bacterium]|nr:hypothetical protein [Betaproteobacteria bacterium]
MEILFFIVAWVVGGFVGAFTLGQVFILARFGIPTAFRWYKNGWLTAPAPVSRYIISLIFLIVVFIVVTWIAVRFFPKYVTGYWIGVGITAFFGLAKSGATNDNLADFVQSNMAYINHAVADELVNKLGVANALHGEKKSNGV